MHALFERTREHPASAMLFEQTTYRVTTTVSVLYFGYVCWQGLASAHAPRGVAPSPQAANVPATAPVPASSAPAPERPGATVSLKPVVPSKTSDPFDWDQRPVEEMRYRYEVWNALGQEKPPRVEVFLKASPARSKTVTPREIDEKGLSFSAANADGATEKIAFGDVSRLRVLSA